MHGFQSFGSSEVIQVFRRKTCKKCHGRKTLLMFTAMLQKRHSKSDDHAFSSSPRLHDARLSRHMHANKEIFLYWKIEFCFKGGLVPPTCPGPMKCTEQREASLSVSLRLRLLHDCNCKCLSLECVSPQSLSLYMSNIMHGKWTHRKRGRYRSTVRSLSCCSLWPPLLFGGVDAEKMSGRNALEGYRDPCRVQNFEGCQTLTCRRLWNEVHHVWSYPWSMLPWTCAHLWKKMISISFKYNRKYKKPFARVDARVWKHHRETLCHVYRDMMRKITERHSMYSPSSPSSFLDRAVGELFCDCCSVFQAMNLLYKSG